MGCINVFLRFVLPFFFVLVKKLTLTHSKHLPNFAPIYDMSAEYVQIIPVPYRRRYVYHTVAQMPFPCCTVVAVRAEIPIEQSVRQVQNKNQNSVPHLKRKPTFGK